METGRYLKQQDRGVQLIGVQPSESFNRLEGLKYLSTQIAPDIYDASLPDRQIGIETEEAFSLLESRQRLGAPLLESRPGPR